MYKTILRKPKMLFGVLLMGMCLSASAQRQVPLVFDKENTGRYAKRVTPYEQLVPQQSLRNPLMWSNGKGLVKNLKQWEKRRNEISASIQTYEIGRKPTVEKSQVKARMSGDTLLVDVIVNGQTLTLSSTIRYPKTGKAPYPLMIGTSGISLPKDLLEKRGIATMVFHENQVNDYSQWRKKHDRGSYEFDRLYPELKENGAYSEWAWGFSRLLDGLQQVGETVSRIDMKHIGVTGCSYAGKMALFCGAFDERVALTIAQEPGGGGAAAWRLSHPLDSVENLDRTDYHWFLESMRTRFGGDKVYLLPHDRHELCAMVCPRALLVLGNTDYKWLADESAYGSMNAAIPVWEHFGIADRVGYSIIGGHPHCMLPENQYPEVEAYLDRFLLGKEGGNTTVRFAPMFKGK